MIFKRKRRHTRLFVIISPPRCRSSYLDNLLHSHPDIICHSEIFFVDAPMVALPHLPPKDRIFDCDWRESRPREFIDRILLKTQEYAPKIRMVGCKLLLHPYQIDRGLDSLLRFDPLVIHLTRENQLAWYSSLKIANETNIWSTEKPLETQHKIVFEQAEFQRQVDGRVRYDDHAFAQFHRHKIKYISVEYESLSKWPTIKKILNFLDLPEAALTSKVVPQNTSNILNRFLNQEEVKAFAASIGKTSWIEN